MTFEVTILGSNAAVPAHGRHQTSQVVKVGGETLMVDCGESAQTQLKRYGEKLGQLKRIFISHLHGDHYYGLIGLLSTMHLFGRKSTLYIYGPPGLREIIVLQQYYAKTSLNYEIEYTEWVEGEEKVICEADKFTVTCIPLNHKIPCMGFIFQEKPKEWRINKNALTHAIAPSHLITLKKGLDSVDQSGKILYSKDQYALPPHPSYSYAYCSDTLYTPDLIEKLVGVNVLYHEATFMEEHANRAADTYHSTAKQAAQIAKNSGVKKLIIGHFSNRYTELEPILNEAKEVFENSFLAIEGEKFKVGG